MDLHIGTLVLAIYVLPFLVFAYWQARYVNYMASKIGPTYSISTDLDFRWQKEQQFILEDPKFARIVKLRGFAFRVLVWLYGGSFLVALLVIAMIEIWG